MRPIIIAGFVVLTVFGLALLVREGRAGCSTARESEPGVAGDNASQPDAGGGGRKIYERFKQFDHNGDGVVSSKELGRPALFQKIDTDGDGFITPKEARNYLQERRQGTGNEGKQENKVEQEDDQADADVSSPTKGSEAGSASLADMKQYPNLRYAEMAGVDPNLLSLDVYAPAAGQHHPVMVMIHGGGWQKGDKATPNIGVGKAKFFVPLGYVFISVNYRLSPAVKHPAHVQDIAKAIAWIHTNVSRYGGNPDGIFVMGHSAGAHLAALVATDESYLAAVGKDLTIIKGVIVNDSAGIDLPRAIDELQGGKLLLRMYDEAFGTDRKVWAAASPARHIAPHKGIPPFLIFFHEGSRATRTTLSDDFVKALGQAGVSAKLIPVPGKNHHDMNSDIGKPGDLLTVNILSFLKSAASAGPAPASSTGAPAAEGATKEK